MPRRNPPVTLVCQHAPCGGTIPGKGRRYCSLACAGANKSARNRVSRVCPCGAAFSIRRSRSDRGQGIYCSNPCRIKYHVWPRVAKALPPGEKRVQPVISMQRILGIHGNKPPTQKIETPTRYRSELRGSWWSDAPESCDTCSGGLWVVRSDTVFEPDQAVCRLCARVAFIVRDARPVDLEAFTDQPLRRGRPPKGIAS